MEWGKNKEGCEGIISFYHTFFGGVWSAYNDICICSFIVKVRCSGVILAMASRKNDRERVLESPKQKRDENSAVSISVPIEWFQRGRYSCGYGKNWGLQLKIFSVLRPYYWLLLWFATLPCHGWEKAHVYALEAPFTNTNTTRVLLICHSSYLSSPTSTQNLIFKPTNFLQTLNACIN